jgi:hypothetical protein
MVNHMVSKANHVAEGQTYGFQSHYHIWLTIWFPRPIMWLKVNRMVQGQLPYSRPTAGSTVPILLRVLKRPYRLNLIKINPLTLK